MKATLRLFIAAAVLVSAQMSFAADNGSTTPACACKTNGQLVKGNFEPPVKAPAAAPATGSAS